MNRLLPVIVAAACLLLIVALTPKPDWDKMACASDVFAEARVEVRNVKRHALGQQPLECHETGRLDGFLGLMKDDERR